MFSLICAKAVERNKQAKVHEQNQLVWVGNPKPFENVNSTSVSELVIGVTDL